MTTGPVVRDAHLHLVTAVEDRVASWFVWSHAKDSADGQGFARVRATLVDEEDAFKVEPLRTKEQVLESIARHVTPSFGLPVRTPDGWTEGRPYWVLTPKLFTLGVVRARAYHADSPSLQHLGEGVWDIDAEGAAIAVQFALFGGVVFG